MARIFKTPFGAQGDTEQVPEAPQGDGSVSLTQGFGYDYEREYEDPAAKDIRREVMNGLFHDITEAIGDIQLSGIAKWDADAAPYPAGAVVWHDSVAWMSTAGNNNSVPGTGADWTELAGDAADVLRQDLANPDKGAAMVARGAVSFGSLKELAGIDAGLLREDLQYDVAGFYAGRVTGGGSFKWDPSLSKTQHNAVTIIDPLRLAAWDGTFDGLPTLYTAGLSGSGCFVRIGTDRVLVDCAGAVPGSDKNNARAIERAAEVAANIGVDVVGPEYDLYAHYVYIGQTCRFRFKNKLVRTDSSESDHLIWFAGANSSIYCKGFDNNAKDAGAEWNAGGRAECVRITGKDTYVYDSEAARTANRTGNGPWFLNGPGIVLDRCKGRDTTGTAFRLLNCSDGFDINGDPKGVVSIIDCESINCGKSWSTNGNNGLVIVDNLRSSGTEGTDAFLIETGGGRRLKRVEFRNFILDDHIGVHNLFKIVQAKEVAFYNVKLYGGETTNTVTRFQIQYPEPNYQKCDFEFHDCEFSTQSSTGYIIRDERALGDTFFRRCKFRAPNAPLEPITLTSVGVHIFEDCGYEVPTSTPAINLTSDADPASRVINIRPYSLTENVVTMYNPTDRGYPPRSVGAYQVLDELPNVQVSRFTGGVAVQRSSGYPRAFVGPFSAMHGSGVRVGDAVYSPDGVYRAVTAGTVSTTAWATETAYSANSMVYSGAHVYRAVTAGTSGSTPPSHTTGSISDGGVTWEYFSPKAEYTLLS